MKNDLRGVLKQLILRDGAIVHFITIVQLRRPKNRVVQIG